MGQRPKCKSYMDTFGENKCDLFHHKDTLYKTLQATAANETTITSKMSPKLQSCCSKYIFIKMKNRFGSRRKHLQSLSVAKE